MAQQTQTQQTQGKPLMPPVNTTSLSDAELDKQLKIEQLQALQRARAEAEAKELAAMEAFELAKQRKKEIARALEQEQAKNMETQATCLHSNSGKSIVVGMGTWDYNHPIYVCQSCLKIWEGCHPPGHLMPKNDSIGRPQVS